MLIPRQIGLLACIVVLCGVLIASIAILGIGTLCLSAVTRKAEMDSGCASETIHGGNVDDVPAAGEMKKCAFVTLVMIGDAYVPGALILGSSLRTVKTRHALVCMVTSDVSKGAREDLSVVFDEVVPIDYIEHRASPLRSEKQRKLYSWASKSFTKWSCLKLTRYSKIIMLDSDICFLRNADDLFELKAPAGCFSTPWAKPYAEPNGLMNPYLEYYRRTSRNPDARDIPHGTRLPARLVAKSLEYPTFTVLTAVVLLEPSSDTFAMLMKTLSAKTVYGERIRLLSNTPEEALIAEVMSSVLKLEWTHIHQKYEVIPRKPEWLGLKAYKDLEQDTSIRAYHYLGTKPWELSPDRWEDLEPWWAEAGRLTASNPSLKPRVEGGASVATDLDIEFDQMRLTSKIQNIIRGKIPASAQSSKQRLVYEIDNILERWLIAMANLPRGETWATVYRRTKPDDPINTKMVNELVEKRIVATASDSSALVSLIIETVGQRLDQQPRATGATAACSATSHPPTISLGSKFSTEMSPRMQKLAGLFPCDQVLRAILRYEVVLGRGQQWGLTQAHFDDLYSCGVRNEGFASPLNSRLLGKPDAHFCSLFPDTDSVFGSLGDFFLVKFSDHKGGWQVNPPFIESLLNHAAAKVIRELDAEPNVVFFLMPAWRDSECYRTLHSTKHLVLETLLPRDRYMFELPDSKQIVSRVDCIYFLLVSTTLSTAETRNMGDIIKRVVAKAAPACREPSR